MLKKLKNMFKLFSSFSLLVFFSCGSPGASVLKKSGYSHEGGQIISKEMLKRGDREASTLILAANKLEAEKDTKELSDAISVIYNKDARLLSAIKSLSDEDLKRLLAIAARSDNDAVQRLLQSDRLSSKETSRNYLGNCLKETSCFTITQREIKDCNTKNLQCGKPFSTAENDVHSTITMDENEVLAKIAMDLAQNANVYSYPSPYSSYIR